MWILRVTAIPFAKLQNNTTAKRWKRMKNETESLATYLFLVEPSCVYVQCLEDWAFYASLITVNLQLLKNKNKIIGIQMERILYSGWFCPVFWRYIACIFLVVKFSANFREAADRARDL